MTHSTDPTIIVGGGFTGLFTALHLSHQNYSRPVVLIDQKERFSFQPLLYEFLSEEMRVNQVWPRYEDLLQGSDITFVQDKVTGIDLPGHQVELASGQHYPYGSLVLALGSVINHFGVEGAPEHALPFRTGEDAVKLRQHLRDRLQRATQTTNPAERRSLLTVVLVGAGSTGIELAGTLADLLPPWYSELGGDPQEIQVVLLNRSNEILKEDINDYIRDDVQASLQQRAVPVNLCFGYNVTAVRPGEVVYQHQGQTETLPAATIAWTAGVAAHPLIQALPIPQAHRDDYGRVRVTPTLQLPEFPEVFAGGDCAAEAQKPLPLLAQVAYQEAAAIAHNLQALAEGRDLEPVDVHLRGSLLKLGVGESVANLFDRVEVKGYPGHLIRQGTYLKLLPTPVHNFKATTEWFVDELFHRHHSPQVLIGSGVSS